MRAILKRVLSPPLVLIAAALILFEETLIKWVQRLMARLAALPLVAALEERARRLPPYPAMLLFLLSLGGFPPTAGFFGKLYLFRVALGRPELLVPVLIAIANSLVSVYYYLRVITAMYFRPAPSKPVTSPIRSNAVSLAMLVAALLVLGFGAMPEWLANLCASAGLGG